MRGSGIVKYYRGGKDGVDWTPRRVPQRRSERQLFLIVFAGATRPCRRRWWRGREEKLSREGCERELSIIVGW